MVFDKFASILSRFQMVGLLDFRSTQNPAHSKLAYQPFQMWARPDFRSPLQAQPSMYNKSCFHHIILWRFFRVQLLPLIFWHQNFSLIFISLHLCTFFWTVGFWKEFGSTGLPVFSMGLSMVNVKVKVMVAYSHRGCPMFQELGIWPLAYLVGCMREM